MEKKIKFLKSLEEVYKESKNGELKDSFFAKIDHNLTSCNGLNPFYSFDNFIEGDCNRLARSAGYAVAQRPGATSFNPFILYSSVGLGKTHLVQAIGNEILNGSEKKVVHYVSSKFFSNQFNDAIRSNKIQAFSDFYLKVDVLIIDDIQFFEGEEKNQEILFHIFDHLFQSGGQIILTSGCSPNYLKGLMKRLVSRFERGLSADLQAPDYETRMAIIHQKIQTDGIDIPESVIEYLAYRVAANVRELEEVIISLIANSSLVKKEIDLELAKQTLKSIVHDTDAEIGIDYIQKTVSEFFKVSIDQLNGKTRKKEIVMAQQLVMYFSKEYTSLTLKSIGDHFGGRHRSTVIHAVQTVNDLKDADASFKKAVDELHKKLEMKAM